MGDIDMAKIKILILKDGQEMSTQAGGSASKIAFMELGINKVYRGPCFCVTPSNKDSLDRTIVPMHVVERVKYEKDSKKADKDPEAETASKLLKSDENGPLKKVLGVGQDEQ